MFASAPLFPAFWSELDGIIASLHESIRRWRRNFGQPDPTPEPEPNFSEQLLERIYAHGGAEHEGEWLRLTHQDLSVMSDAQIANERARLRLRLMLDPGGSDLWLSDRVGALEAEIAHRG